MEDMPDEELAEMGIPKSHIRSEIIPPEVRLRSEKNAYDTELLVA